MTSLHDQEKRERWRRPRLALVKWRYAPTYTDGTGGCGLAPLDRVWRLPLESSARNDLPLVDGHLDLAENVTLFGRDLTRTVAHIRAREKRTSHQATVSLPELERGGIAVVC